MEDEGTSVVGHAGIQHLLASLLPSFRLQLIKTMMLELFRLRIQNQELFVMRGILLMFTRLEIKTGL